MTAARRRAAPPIPGPNVPATSSGSEPSEPEARDWLEPDETVLATLTGSGASLFATERRLVIVRSGAGFRPRTGVRSWPYDRLLQVSLSRPMRGQALIHVRTGRLAWQAVSMFFDSRQLREAQHVIDEIRQRL